MTDCDFRELPAPTSYEEEIAAEPWFSVHENDIFPEEFPRFLGLRPDLLETLVGYHGDLFQAVAWRRVQTALRAGNILDIFPYGADKRLLGSAERNAVSCRNRCPTAEWKRRTGRAFMRYSIQGSPSQSALIKSLNSCPPVRWPGATRHRPRVRHSRRRSLP